jgi:hypothetical protein
MRRSLIALAGFALLAATVAASAFGTANAPEARAQRRLALPASVVDIQRPVSTASFATLDYGKHKTGQTSWRVVQGTGNCCENYLTVTKAGRLLDFGGTYVNYTDDRGLHWKQVQPATPLVNGEGTLDLAPNGDVIAIGWDPYSGDHLQAFKYEAFSGKWWWTEQPLHTPFYDREWVTVVPGPFSIDGATYPYVSFLKGGYPSKELWLYSTDGLTYDNASLKFVDDTQNGTKAGALPTAKLATADWTQGNTNAGLAALGAGGALAAPDEVSDWSLLDPATLTWSGYQFPGNVSPRGLYQVDSAGRVHNVVPAGDGFDYRLSADGGKTWKSLHVALPDRYSIDQIDFRANKAAGVAAVVIHAPNEDTGNDQDWVWKFSISGTSPVLQRRYTVGLGDAGSAAGVGNDVRMDFETIGIFGDGRVAISFLDSTTQYPSPTTGQMQQRPAIAIEQDSKF